MFEVKIYIETSLQGPAKKAGSYAAIVEYINKAGEPVTRQVEGYEEETTFHKSTITAAVKALERLTKDCHVIIYTNCTYFKNTAEGEWLDIWQGNNWKKTDGEDVKYKKLWSVYQSYRNIHDIEVRFSKHHEYKRYLQDTLARIEKEHAKVEKTLILLNADGISEEVAVDSANVG